MITRATPIPMPMLNLTRDMMPRAPPNDTQIHMGARSSVGRLSTETQTIRTSASTSSIATFVPKYRALTSEMPPAR